MTNETVPPTLADGYYKVLAYLYNGAVTENAILVILKLF